MLVLHQRSKMVGNLLSLFKIFIRTFKKQKRIRKRMLVSIRLIVLKTELFMHLQVANRLLSIQNQAIKRPKWILLVLKNKRKILIRSILSLNQLTQRYICTMAKNKEFLRRYTSTWMELNNKYVTKAIRINDR